MPSKTPAKKKVPSTPRRSKKPAATLSELLRAAEVGIEEAAAEAASAQQQKKLNVYRSAARHLKRVQLEVGTAARL